MVNTCNYAHTYTVFTSKAWYNMQRILGLRSNAMIPISSISHSQCKEYASHSHSGEQYMLYLLLGLRILLCVKSCARTLVTLRLKEQFIEMC